MLPRRDDDTARSAPLGERLFGVADQVQHDLLQLERIGPRARQCRVEIDVEVDLRRAQGVATQRHRIGDDRVQVRIHPLGRALPCEGEQVSHDLRGAARLVVNRVDGESRVGIVRNARGEQQLRERHHRRERVVELVRHTADELADGGELLLLQHLVGDALLVGDVAHDAQRTHDDPFVEHGRRDHRPRAHGTIGGVEAERRPGPFARQRAVQQVGRRDPIARIHQRRERSTEQGISGHPDGQLEGAIHGGEAPGVVQGEDGVRGRLDEAGVSRLRPGERASALALVGHVARHTQHADDFGAVTHRRVRDRHEAVLAVSPQKTALVPHRRSRGRPVEVLDGSRELTLVVEQMARRMGQQRATPIAAHRDGRLVHRSEGAAKVHRVNRVAGGLEQVAVARLRLRDGVARAPLVGHVA